jgi:hypothetical protein
MHLQPHTTLQVLHLDAYVETLQALALHCYRSQQHCSLHCTRVCREHSLMQCSDAPLLCVAWLRLSSAQSAAHALDGDVAENTHQSAHQAVCSSMPIDDAVSFTQ